MAKRKKEIRIKDWNYFVNYLNSAKKILVVSKGKTNSDIHTIEKNYDICIGVKQAILLLGKKDILVMNDLEGLFGLEECIKDIKYIVCPIRTHIGSKPHNNGNQFVVNYLKHYKFRGKLIYYRFREQENKNLLRIPKTCSGDIIHNFLNKCSNKRDMEIHHIGLYTNLKDNEVISNYVKNAQVWESYKIFYTNWIKNKYTNKKKTNINFLTKLHNGIEKNELMKTSQNTLVEQFPSLNMKFFEETNDIPKRNFVCFIPARYASSRLPGKPLLEINHKTIIQRVHEQVQKCKNVDKIIVLTDDKRIKNTVNDFGGECHITGDCLNGTSRIVNFMCDKNVDCDLVINVQGDEPFINPANIDACIENFVKKSDSNPDMKCSTLHFKHCEEEEVRKRSNGKLVLDKNNNIMYGSRNIIPGMKKVDYDGKTIYHGHIGIFVYDKEYLLKDYLKSNTPYQLAEDIEWLKILEDGYKINSVLVDKDSHERGVDTQEDYDYLEEKYKVEWNETTSL